jgi:hypothetical protein
MVKASVEEWLNGNETMKQYTLKVEKLKTDAVKKAKRAFHLRKIAVC